MKKKQNDEIKVKNKDEIDDALTFKNNSINFFHINLQICLKIQ